MADMTTAKTLTLRGPLMTDVAGPTLTDQERTFLCHPSVGAVILFSRNFESKGQIAALIADIKSLRDPALLVAVDQEGGRVQRFRKDFHHLPAPLTIGERYLEDSEAGLKLAYDSGRQMAEELIEIGVDFSFAPVLDRADERSKVIGDRAFHADPIVITALAGRYIDGMHDAGMKATGKHFPGHGGVHDDSHLVQPVDRRSMQTLYRGDMRPYRELGNKLDAIMTAHVQFPKVDSALPTFSWTWLRKVLRQELGFSGLIFSDDLTMKGAHNAGGIEERATKALEAGCDMVLVCNSPKDSRKVAKHLESRGAPHQVRLQRMEARLSPA